MEESYTVSKAQQIAREVLTAVGGKSNIAANEICMTRLRILTQDPSLIDVDQLTAMSGVLGIVQRGSNGIEVVFGPGKVEGVHEALADLTGVDSAGDVFSPAEAAASASMNVIVNEAASTKRAAEKNAAQDAPAEQDQGGLAEVQDLISLLGQQQESEDADGRCASVLVVNGPNINMLGIREPGIYGRDSYADLLQLCQDSAAEAGFDKCTCFQSNHEGDIVDAIQDAYGNYDGIVINPGAYTHTSIALLDAAKAVGLPVVEVHISKVDEREEFRQVSYIRAACFETITGLGIQGYRKAIFDLAERLGIL